MGASVKQVDLTNVKDGGGFNRSRIPSGDYLAKIIKVEDAPSKKDNIFQYLFTIQVVNRPSSKLPYYCKLQENQLWKLRSLLIAAGKTVPKSKVKVDPNQVVGKLIGITVEDDDYEDKEQSTISGVFPASDLADATGPIDEAEEEAEEAADEPLDDDIDGPSASVEDDEEDESTESADPYAGMDRAALKAEIKKLDASFVAKKSQTDEDLKAILVQLADQGSSEEDLDELDIDDI